MTDKITDKVFKETSMRYPRFSTWCDPVVIKETAQYSNVSDTLFTWELRRIIIQELRHE